MHYSYTGLTRVSMALYTCRGAGVTSQTERVSESLGTIKARSCMLVCFKAAFDFQSLGRLFVCQVLLLRALWSRRLSVSPLVHPQGRFSI